MKSATTLSYIFALFVLTESVQAAPEIQHWITPNGASVYFVAAPEIPIIDVRFVFAAGGARDGEEHGLARLVSQLLQDGAGELDANQFNEQIAATGSQFSTGVLRDMAWVSLRTLSEAEYSAPALSLLEAVLSAPRFERDAFERRQANALVGIKREKQSPAAIARNAFHKALYSNHPYGSSLRGTEASVAAVTYEKVRAFHQKYYVPTNATVAIVGAVTRAQAEKIATQLSTGMQAGDQAPALPPVEMLTQAREQQIEFPSIQSHVRIGQPGLQRGDEDYFPLLVGNHVLGGGGLVSILFDEVREKRGLSYSVSSNFSPMAGLGPFTASLQTDNSQVDEAISVLRDEIKKFIEQGPNAAALSAAKKNLIGGFPLRISSNAKTIEYLTMIGFYNLPLDYLETFPNHVAAVTAEQVREAFQRRLKADKMVTIIVGKSNKGGS